jgi:nifR3 family TIM-barrel protein
MPNFWEKLNKPFFALAPMEDVTDVAFREMFAKYGKPEVMYTEFVNVDGLTHPEGYKRLSQDLKFTEIQRSMVAQIWGRDPQKFFEAAQIVAKLGFDGVDINLGCPQDKEIGLGTCAALIREPKLVGEIIAAVKKGAGGLPVSVKTRIGYSKPEIEEWIGFLLKQELSAIAIHARTKQEKSKVPAQWGEVKKAVELRNKLGNKTLIMGNGDVKSREEGLLRIAETGCDGVMVGRGAFGSPWFFRNDNYQPSIKERLSVMLEHAQLFEKEFSGIKSFVIMRKHFKAYASGFDGAHELRAKLMETKNLEETQVIVNDFLNQTKAV